MSPLEWGRIKTIILAILVVTNLSLLAFVVQRGYQSRRAETLARENAILFLQNNGISLDEDLIPREIGLLPQTVERDLLQEAKAASDLLGGGVQEQSWGGGMYRYYNDKGYLQFHSDGSFQGEFVKGVFPAGDAPDFSRQLLQKLNFDGEEIASTASSTGDSTESAVTLRQKWRGAPIFNNQVTLRYQDGALSSMTDGRRLLGEPELDPTQTPISVPTALFQFYHGLTALGDVCSRIDGITEGYVSSAASVTGASALTPTWYISTDTGAYLLNALTGSLSRAETDSEF